MEPPSHCLLLKAADRHLNLTVSYHRDSDTSMWYSWLKRWPGQLANARVNLSAKTELVT